MSVRLHQHKQVGHKCETICRRSWVWSDRFVNLGMNIVFAHVASWHTSVSVLLYFTGAILLQRHIYPRSTEELIFTNKFIFITPDPLWPLFAPFFAIFQYSDVFARTGDYRTLKNIKPFPTAHMPIHVYFLNWKYLSSILIMSPFYATSDHQLFFGKLPRTMMLNFIHSKSQISKVTVWTCQIFKRSFAHDVILSGAVFYVSCLSSSTQSI